MVPLNSPELEKVARFLKKYDFRSSATLLAGLLTVPSLQANTIRIETLVHLAVAHCRGKRKPGLPVIRNWLNRQLGDTQITRLEDPVEDVFITNVETPDGNCRVFEGIWESNDYFSQVVIETLNNSHAPQECQGLLIPVFALLRLSECLAYRIGLPRWHIEPSTSKGEVRLAPATRIEDRAQAVVFTPDDLDSLGISRESLEPFILTDADKLALAGESTGHSSLERRPLVDFGGDLVLVLPHAPSPAIRRFLLSELRQMGYLDVYGEVLAACQARQVEKDGLWELKNEVESLEPPEPEGQVPSLHAWLLKYDINKYLHVVLLHDRLELLDEEGLSSFMQYPEPFRDGLEAYLSKSAEYCRALPDFSEGMTLLVIGGLGRGFALGFEEWPDQWRLSVIRISDLLMLASELDQPVIRYLKCIKQKEWAEREGVYFQNVNGDYNFYCFWRRLRYQLVPRDLPVNESSMLSIGNDMVQPIREEVRILVDRHVVQTTNGSYSPVMRFGRDAYFKSMQGRPIYASLGHLRSGVLAGVVETSRGPSWLLVIPQEGDERIRRLLYEMWSGFIGLYDRLVFEVEALYPEASPDVIEIRLNFGGLIVSDDYLEPRPGVALGEPEVNVDLERRTADVKFPSDFLMHFQQPDNTGEQLVLHAIADGLVSLHQGVAGDVAESILNGLISKVIGDSGMRVLHLFRTYYPIEHLLSRQSQKPVFLAHEDFVFTKLKLSEGCTAARPYTSLASKQECNDFLHRVVDKVWNQLREELRQLDRASVIREVLRVHEAVIQDRDHWRRTAQALLSLYAPVDDVFAVAQERESDRNNVSLPARTILEMAICECPAEGGRQLSRWEMDEVLAKAALLVEVATDSDAINSDLIEPRIYLHANGEYTINRDFHNTIIKPFLTAYFQEEFEGAASKYSTLYGDEGPAERTRADEVFSPDYIGAFQVEYGLTPDEAIDGFAELMDLAVAQNNVVVETTLGDLKSRLINERGMSSNACEAFIRSFSIYHRPAWDVPPTGYRNRDLNPWRFRRRLSATARPVLVFGEEDNDKVFFGAGSFRLGFGYVLDRTERGQLPQEFYTTAEMKRYIGAVNSERGHEFARNVADQLCNNGWQVRNEVQMTELGASAELGDIDVLAWKASGEVKVIECKRIQLARTVAEVAEICRRFRGEAKDELDKHVQRVKWVMSDPACLQRIVGFVPDQRRIDDRLVTNTHVPMMYLSSLPIRAEKIGPLR